jgi:hypothetical protein
MCGCGSGAILEAFPIPLGSTATLFNPPAFAGPRAIPLMGTFPVAAEPGLRANCAYEAAGVASTSSTAKAIFTVVFGMGKLHRDSRERRMREADVGSRSAATIKLKFRIDAAVRTASVCTEVAQVPGKSGKNSPEAFSNIFLSGGCFGGVALFTNRVTGSEFGRSAAILV